MNNSVFKKIIAKIVLLLLIGLTGCGVDRPPAAGPSPAIEKETTAAIPPQPARIIEPTSTAPRSAAPSEAGLVATPEAILTSHGDRSRPYVALTFDACQSPYQQAGYDRALVNILVETGTPATLFLGGLWMQHHPAQTKALAAHPLFELGNHSWSHADFTTLTPEEMSREIERTQAIMRSLTGQTASLFRFPGGSYNSEALAVVGRHKLRSIQWDVAPGDPDPNVSAEALVEQVTRQTQNGSIVVLHLNGWGWHTAEALPVLIKQLRREGYTFVTVSQLLKKSS